MLGTAEVKVLLIHVVDIRFLFLCKKNHGLLYFLSYSMKDSTGWHLIWTSPYMESVVERIAINAKVVNPSNQDNTNKMVAASSGSTIHLWSVSDDGCKRDIGKVILLPVFCGLF